jgi:cystathionine gamma-synthase
MDVTLGLSVPPHTPHAISVSLPTWRDNVEYEEGQKRVLDSMVSGYPRFFIQLNIRKVGFLRCWLIFHDLILSTAGFTM